MSADLFFSNYDDDEYLNINIFDDFPNDNLLELKPNMLEPIEKSLINNKQKIFNVKTYDFLKKKREETIDKSKFKKPWTKEEDERLINIISNSFDESWQLVATKFPGRTHSQCMHRWQKVLQPGLKKGKWSEEEDKILVSWVMKKGASKWCKLAKYLKGRSSKQIRDRWINNLNPHRSKTFTWTEELDKILIIKYLENGSSWVNISKFIPNSTENMIKNRFYSLLRSVAAQQKKKIRNMSSHSTQSKDLLKNKNFDSHVNFDYDYNTKCVSSKNSNSQLKQHKRKNYPLKILINYLPDLLEKKILNYEEIKNIKEKKELEEIKYDFYIPSINEDYFKENLNTGKTSHDFPSQISFNDDQKKILSSFFNTLSEKFPIKSDIENSLNVEKSNAQFKFKSTILLNLQLTLLNKIFERCKLQIVNRFFQFFKGNSVNSN